ncbi:FecR family protein [Sphingobacterium psychroaquaticum]|uniref:FecR family protein n=1 Tax=Sphingobacterium psychroaquaticum TaxID=561061 RepID=A0A1X7LCY1_9SPHI|nr:FecR family protein [Sphingobacterium psychroaquaticum]
MLGTFCLGFVVTIKGPNHLKSEVNLKELFSRYVAGKASADELSYLLDLFQQEEDSVLLRALILEELENEEQLSLTTHQHAILDRVSVVLHQNIHRRKALMRKLYIGWSAAAVLLMTGLWIGYKWMSSGPSILNSTEEVAIVPGADKATLVLEDGRVIVLDSNTNIEGKEKFVFADSGGMMTFSSACLPAPEKGQSRTVQTPKGGQFAILLADGSKVWLNAESSITFPTQFDQSKRSVEITGEVYFEVAKDQSKPFLVHTRQQTIQVLGTHFNVNAYRERKVVQTSLLEGSVAVLAGGKKVRLYPGQMSLWNQDGGGLNVETIPDMENLLAWKDGMFYFDNSNIKEIMLVLARWYNVEFVFEEGDYSNCVFDGMISKKESINQVLKILGASQQLSFEIMGNKIVVSQPQS